MHTAKSAVKSEAADGAALRCAPGGVIDRPSFPARQFSWPLPLASKEMLLCHAHNGVGLGTLKSGTYHLKEKEGPNLPAHGYKCVSYFGQVLRLCNIFGNA